MIKPCESSFAPWTANVDEESRAVHYLSHLKTNEHRDWRHALRRWLWHGLPTETVKHYVANFCFVYCLPRELWLYQRGAPEGVGLLLQHLRGENIDWDAYRDSREPSSVCSTCRKIRRFGEFTDAQWQLARANRAAICIYCEKGKNAKPRPLANKPMAKHQCSQSSSSRLRTPFRVHN